MILRRLLVVLIVLLITTGLGWLMHLVLAPGGWPEEWTIAKILIMASFLAVLPWAGLCAANGVIGFAILMRKPRGMAEPPDPGPLPRTAIVVTVRNEDMRSVLPPLGRLMAALDAVGMGDAFAVCILSDTDTADATAEEERQIALFRTADRLAGRVFYRRRAVNAGFKAGNIMDFLDHHADGFALMLVLDADSRMSARAVLRLVRTMRDDPGLGIAQHLTVGLPASSAFPRLFQFGMRAGMRGWAAALTWWQGDEACYWGHNAIVRIAPFRNHCRLPPLPDGRPILSHDQVEAAMLAGAGWGVRLIAEENGSAEMNPPALPEFMRRELRWLAGNLEYWHLLRMRGLGPMGRWQLVQAILMFGVAPCYLVLLLAAAWAAATDETSLFPALPAFAVTLGWFCAIYAPKLLGYAEVLMLARERARYGGTGRVLAGVAAETIFALLIEPTLLVARTATMARLLMGGQGRWMPQNRGDRPVSWREATRLFWPQTVLGVVVFGAFASAGWVMVAWALPLAGGLLVSVPFCVITAEPRVGAWLRRWGVAAVPEEIQAWRG